MIEHVLHYPRSQRRNIEIPFAGDSNKCPFCGAYGFTAGTRCRCGIWSPSENSYKRPRPPKRRKTPPSTLPIYRPQFDGISDRDPYRDHEGLAPYRAQFDKIDPAGDVDGVPWED